ncbi:MAG: DUF2243 domain-containing protein [Massilia sp.]
MRIGARQREQRQHGQAPAPASEDAVFPSSAGILFGLGFGAFFDGIVFHQLLQWHHMVSSWYPPDNLPNLRLNTLWDGIFHSAAYVVLVIAVYRFFLAARAGQHLWSIRPLAGSALLGWGIFNLVEGVIDHLSLGVHHVNELVDVRQRWLWDGGFLLWGTVMLAVGWALLRSGQGRPGRGAAAP